MKMRGSPLAAKRRHSFRRDAGDAFLPDPASGTFIRHAEAESAAEEFIASVTSADFVLEESRNELSMDEIGGPYLEDDDSDLDIYD